MTEVNFHIPDAYDDDDPRSNVRLLKIPRKHAKTTTDLRAPKWTSDDAAGEQKERRYSRASADLEADSQASRSSQDTEKDVFFPLRGQNPRPDDIDFTELDEFLSDERAALTFSSKGSQNISAPILASGSSRSGDVSQNALRYSPKVDTVGEKTYFQSLDSERSTLATREPFANKQSSAEDLPLEISLPDRFSYYHSLHDETIHAPDLLLLIPEGQSTSNFFNDGESTWWLDCTCATDEEVQALAKAFALHPLTAEDIRMQEPHEKVEMFHNYYFMCFHTFEQDRESEDFLEPIHMYVVVFRAGVLTFHSAPTSNPANVRRRIRQLRDYVDVSSDWICYALIDDVTDGFAPIITSIEYEADAIDDSVYITRSVDYGSMLKRIGECRQTVMSLMKLLSNKADVIKMFAKRCQENFSDQYYRMESPHHDSKVMAPRGDIALYLGDIQDHIVTMFQNLSAYEKILSRSQANYLAQLQVESFDSNLSFTKLLETVTILGTLFVPINIITGLFGMNVLIPGKDDGKYWWFIGIVLVLFAVSVLVFVLVKIYAHNNIAVKERDFEEAMLKSIRSAKMKRSKAKSMVSFRGYDF